MLNAPVVMIGLVWLIALGFQVRLLSQVRSGNSRTLSVVYGIPLLIAAVVIIGSVAYSFMYYDDPDRSNTYAYNQLFDRNGLGYRQKVGLLAFTFSMLINPLVFSVLIFVKSLLSPLASGWIVSYTIYYYVKYDELRILPFMENTLNFLMPDIGPGAATIYTMMFLGFTVLLGMSKSDPPPDVDLIS